MRRLLNHLFLLGIIVLLGSCSKDDTTDPTPTPEPTPGPQTPVNVELCLEPAAMETRAMDENAIDDINVYFYSEEGSLNYHFYFEEYAPSFTFQMQAGNYELYVVTNVHKDLGEMPEEELIKCEYWGVNMKSDIPMTAQTKVNILSDTTLPTLQVKRAAAKIAYTITVDPSVSSTIQLRSIQFCNVPNSVILFDSKPASTSEEDYYDDAIVDIDDPQTYSAVCYMLENCQGEVESITDPKDKSPENAPKCASYMRILADSREGDLGELLEYIVYLGENTTSNFDVRKNTKHTMNLVIKGKNEIDNRVMVYEGLYYGVANSVICTGNSVSFDVTPYRTSYSKNYAYTNIYAGKEYEAASVKLIWEGKNGLISSLSLKGTQLSVKTNGSKGNAVVAICDEKGIIRWSFHIWCTGGDTPRSVLYENYAKARFEVMDRNLGALAASPTDHENSMGLIYQWGRKDPFPSKNEDNVFTPTGSGVFQTCFPTISGESELEDLLQQMVTNPANFVKSADGLDDENAMKLWGDPDGNDGKYNTSIYQWSGNKSVYDPCPEGYRVANRYTWTGVSKKEVDLVGDTNSSSELTTSQINITGKWNNGWYFTGVSESAYWPATCSRSAGGKLDSSYNDTSWYWSSSVKRPYGDNKGNVFGMKHSYINIKNDRDWGYDPEFGFSVRCVKE